MSFTFAKELASKEADERMLELEITPEARAVLYRMAYNRESRCIHAE